MGLHLSKLHVEAFGCVKRATLELGRLHALIGPNDSGKTTLLEATRLLAVPAARCGSTTKLIARFAGSGFCLRHAPRGGGAVLEWLASPSSSDPPAWSFP